jgi:hypothetical protein
MIKFDFELDDDSAQLLFTVLKRYIDENKFAEILHPLKETNTAAEIEWMHKHAAYVETEIYNIMLKGQYRVEDSS